MFILIGLLTPSQWLTFAFGSFIGGLWQACAIFAFIGWFMYACARRYREEPWEYTEEPIEWVGDAEFKYSTGTPKFTQFQIYDGSRAILSGTEDKNGTWEVTRNPLGTVSYGDDIR